MIYLIWGLVIYILWNVSFRNLYIQMKYSRDTKGIVFDSTLSSEELMGLLEQKLKYPGLRELQYDENGNVLIVAEHGKHSIVLKDGRLHVGRIYTGLGGSAKSARNIEEAECLKAYLQKVYDSKAPINPYNQYQRFKKVRKRRLLSMTMLFVAIGGIVLLAAYDAGAIDSISSSGISDSYLTQYSKDATVGEAFENFFLDPRWVSYSEGAKEYVDFKGICEQNGERVQMIITFELYEDSFKVTEISIDGEQLNELMCVSTLTTIFE